MYVSLENKCREHTCTNKETYIFCMAVTFSFVFDCLHIKLHNILIHSGARAVPVLELIIHVFQSVCRMPTLNYFGVQKSPPKPKDGAKNFRKYHNFQYFLSFKIGPQNCFLL